jgi:hypothetical protein
MNDLNAQQIVLLALLVSFVTSIATGITTVSLMEKTPEPFTQTINRVVEKTVERILPPEENKENVTVVKTPEKEVVTVVVKDEDLVIDAVEKNSRSLARIYQKVGNAENFVGLGVVFDNSGRIVTDSSIIQKTGNYIGVYKSGKFDLKVVHRELNEPFAILGITDNYENKNEFSPATFSDSQNLKLAQTVILLSGVNSNTVSTGIISNLESVGGLPKDPPPDAKPIEQLKIIETTVDRGLVLTGSIILNLQGEIVGVRMNIDFSRTNTFSPSNFVKSFISGR